MFLPNDFIGDAGKTLSRFYNWWHTFSPIHSIGEAVHAFSHFSNRWQHFSIQMILLGMLACSPYCSSIAQMILLGILATHSHVCPTVGCIFHKNYFFQDDGNAFSLSITVTPCTLYAPLAKCGSEFSAWEGDFLSKIKCMHTSTKGIWFNCGVHRKIFHQVASWQYLSWIPTGRILNKSIIL